MQTHFWEYPQVFVCADINASVNKAEEPCARKPHAGICEGGAG